MNSLQQAILLNNEGARLLTSGFALSSLQAIQCAGKVLRHAVWNAATHQPVDKHVAMASTVSLPHQQKSIKHDSCLRMSSAFYVYSRPLLFPNTTSMDTQEALDSVVDTLSTYIVFNLAVASHMYGMTTGKRAPLQRAMKLYRALLRTSPIATHFPISRPLLECIVLNNLCHLYMEMRQRAESQLCFHNMRDLIQRTGCLFPGKTSNINMAPHEANEIILNILIHEPPTTAIAA